MAHIDPLLERNKHFATTAAREGTSIVAKYPVYVITCLDPRTDPSAFLELELGDAMVIRNAGGRVSHDVLIDLAYIGYLSEASSTLSGPRFEVAVVHHNQCGTHFLADTDFRPRLRRPHRRRRRRPRRRSRRRPRTNRPHRRRAPPLVRTLLPTTITVSGHVYDVTTGLITTILPAAPMHASSVADPPAPTEIG